MEQQVKEQQEQRHQGHKPADAGKLSKVVAELLPQAVAAEMLEVFVAGREGRAPG